MKQNIHFNTYTSQSAAAVALKNPLTVTYNITVIAESKFVDLENVEIVFFYWRCLVFLCAHTYIVISLNQLGECVNFKKRNRVFNSCTL